MNLTNHARVRCAERGVREEDAVAVALSPAAQRASTDCGDNTRILVGSGLLNGKRRGWVSVVVRDDVIVTVFVGVKRHCRPTDW